MLPILSKEQKVFVEERKKEMNKNNYKIKQKRIIDKLNEVTNEIRKQIKRLH